LRLNPNRSSGSSRPNSPDAELRRADASVDRARASSHRRAGAAGRPPRPARGGGGAAGARGAGPPPGGRLGGRDRRAGAAGGGGDVSEGQLVPRLWGGGMPRLDGSRSLVGADDANPFRRLTGATPSAHASPGVVLVLGDARIRPRPRGAIAGAHGVVGVFVVH